MIIKHHKNDLSPLIGRITWSGSRLQVARKLQFDYKQDARDPNLPNYPINNGETVYGYNEDGRLVFQGNVYKVEKDTQASTVSILAYDHLWVMTRSRTTKKYKNANPADIAKGLCGELGVKPGNIINPGVNVSFIASAKTGYQIIMAAYTEASKRTGKKYHPIMNGDALDIVERGTMIADFEADDRINLTNSRYSESIEQIINQVLVTDEQGNSVSIEKDADSIKKYSMFQEVYKNSKNEDNAANIKKLLEKSKPDRSGSLEALGDYRAVAPYSIKVRDNLFTGKFWVKSDAHTWQDGVHTMRLEMEFEELMNEEKADKEKEEKPKKNSKSKK